MYTVTYCAGRPLPRTAVLEFHRDRVCKELSIYFEGQADWRRGRAQRYPDDECNATAAKIFDRLALQADQCKADPERVHRYAAAFEGIDADICLTATEEQSELGRLIGFHRFPDSVDEYLDELLDRVDRRRI